MSRPHLGARGPGGLRRAGDCRAALPGAGERVRSSTTSTTITTTTKMVRRRQARLTTTNSQYGDFLRARRVGEHRSYFWVNTQVWALREKLQQKIHCGFIAKYYTLKNKPYDNG